MDSQCMLTRNKVTAAAPVAIIFCWLRGLLRFLKRTTHEPLRNMRNVPVPLEHGNCFSWYAVDISTLCLMTPSSCIVNEFSVLLCSVSRVFGHSCPPSTPIFPKATCGFRPSFSLKTSVSKEVLRTCLAIVDWTYPLQENNTNPSTWKWEFKDCCRIPWTIRQWYVSWLCRIKSVPKRPSYYCRILQGAPTVLFLLVRQCVIQNNLA